MTDALETEMLRLQKEMAELQATVRVCHTVLMGDANTSGIVTRVRDLERAIAESGKELQDDLRVMRQDMCEISDALLGDLVSGKTGMLAVVEDHQKSINTISKLGWLLIGGLVSLGLAQIWQAILAYQALTLVQK